MSKPSAAELEYMGSVTKLPCVCCDRPCEELHHPRDLHLGCGIGRKAPHDTVIPLCKFHHDEFHVGLPDYEPRTTFAYMANRMSWALDRARRMFGSSEPNSKVINLLQCWQLV